MAGRGDCPQTAAMQPPIDHCAPAAATDFSKEVKQQKYSAKYLYYLNEYNMRLRKPVGAPPNDAAGGGMHRAAGTRQVARAWHVRMHISPHELHAAREAPHTPLTPTPATLIRRPAGWRQVLWQEHTAQGPRPAASREPGGERAARPPNCARPQLAA